MAIAVLVRAASFLIGYLFGCINPAYILSRRVAGIDIREVGSKNAGTSNVFMTLGPKYGVIIFLGDGLKTALACLVSYFAFLGFGDGWIPVASGVSEDLSALAVFYAGMGCIIGHDFPLFLGFHGGKGTACWILWIFMLDYRIFIPALLLAVLAGWLSKYMVIATVVLVTSTLAALSFFAFNPELFVFVLIFAALSLFMHRNNFKKLKNKTEPKIYGN